MEFSFLVSSFFFFLFLPLTDFLVEWGFCVVGLVAFGFFSGKLIWILAPRERCKVQGSFLVHSLIHKQNYILLERSLLVESVRPWVLNRAKKSFFFWHSVVPKSPSGTLIWILAPREKKIANLGTLLATTVSPLQVVQNYYIFFPSFNKCKKI